MKKYRVDLIEKDARGHERVIEDTKIAARVAAFGWAKLVCDQIEDEAALLKTVNHSFVQAALGEATAEVTVILQKAINERARSPGALADYVKAHQRRVTLREKTTAVRDPETGKLVSVIKEELL